MRVRDLVQKPLLFRAFLFWKLPLAWIAGIRKVRLSQEACSCQIKSRWISNNPWKSMYFAAEAMAAELCTGLLVLNAIETTGYKASNLIVSLESTFHKKAVGTIHFHAFLTQEIQAELIQLTIDQPTSFFVTATGVDQQKEEVATFRFEWSVKRKN